MTLHFLYHRDQIPQLPVKKKKKTKQTQNFKVSVIFSFKIPLIYGKQGMAQWVEFVAGSLPCSERFFSGYSGFPLSL